MYDKRVFIRIHTELLPELDKPTQVARVGDSLAMVYESGNILFSGFTETGRDPLMFESRAAGVTIEDARANLKA